MSLSPYPPLELPPLGVEPNWWPINAAQQAYLNSNAQLALFGGQSGGGKTQVLAADAMQEYQHPRLRALLIRTTLEEQQELEDIQQRMYEPKGAQWSKKRWRFPSGATIRPGYLAHDKDLRRYQGNPYSWLGIDESGQHPEHRIRFMIGWLAAPTASGLRVRGRFTSNPGDDGHAWQMKVFLRNRCPVHYPADQTDDRPFETSVFPGKVYRGATWTDDSLVHKTVAFFPARLADNPLMGREKLESMLTQSKALQQQLLYGCWCNAAGLYFDFMRPDMEIPYATIGDSWWWQHFLSIDYGYGNSSAAAGMYAISPNGTVFKTRERIEQKMDALKFAKCICKGGFKHTEFPKQRPHENWLKKLKARDPEKPRMSFCVMDEAMDQHRGTGKSIYDVMSEVFAEHGIGSIKAAHDPAGNAQVLYNGLANKGIVLTRDSADLSLTYRAVSSRIVDARKAVKKVHGAWEDDCYDECISKGTLIAGEHGDVPIQDVRVGDRVWTRGGLKAVSWSGMTQADALVETLWLSDGTVLTATANHPLFIAGKGFIRLDETSYGDKVLIWPGSRSSCSTGSSFGGIQKRRDMPRGITTRRVLAISAAESTCCIGKSGSIITDPFQPHITSTTETRTRRTMPQAIWNVLTLMPTQRNIPRIGGRTPVQGDGISGDSIDWRAFGTELKRGKRYTAALRKIIGAIQLLSPSPASSADRSSSVTTQEQINFVLGPVVLAQGGSQGLTMRTLDATSVAKYFGATDSKSTSSAPVSVLKRTIGGRGEVYNLSVVECPEFFANGILVHNCSYAYNTWRQNSEKPARTALADELAQMRKDGVDETTLARIAWQRELAIQQKEREESKGIRLSKGLNPAARR